MVLTNNKKANFEELKVEIFTLITSSKTDKELIKALERVLDFYKNSDFTN